MAAPSSESKSLCLNCREVGHVFQQCPKSIETDQYEWFFSSKRKKFTPQADPSDSACERCYSLRLNDLLDEPNSEQGFWDFKSSTPEHRAENQTLWRRLGCVSDLILDNTCPVCCCLFVCSPTPRDASQEIWVFAVQTYCRLGGRFDEKSFRIAETEEHKPYAKYLSLVMWPPRNPDEVDGLVQRGDGLCRVQEAEIDHSFKVSPPIAEFTLGGRVLSPVYAPAMVEEWIGRCSRLHPSTCQPIWSPSLSNIRLLDVQTRTVVPHPGNECDYVALSYVWGPTLQSAQPFGIPLSPLPQTIEDAIKVTLDLGKRFLWVDSVCIDQGSSEHKNEQIALMCDIYRGAYCTLIAVSSTSASSGIVRVSSTVPQIAQLSCMVSSPTKEKSVRLVTIGSTLSQTVWSTTWGRRAWTFQEALLSPRNIYLCEQQLHFECNAMTCCESLDDTASRAHNLLWDDDFIDETPEAKYGLGVLRNPFVGQSRRPERMREWSNLLVLYMYRDMTNSGDSLNAFTGVLKALEDDLYTGGFFWGIPREQFNLGLLWMGRYDLKRREAFPSWSWCGWEGALWGPGTFFEDGIKASNQGIQPHVKVETVIGGTLKTIFDNEHIVSQAENIAEDDLPSLQNLSLEPGGKRKDNLECLAENHPGIISITAPILTFKFTLEARASPDTGELRWRNFMYREATIHIAYMYCGREFEDLLGKEVVDWLMIAREKVVMESEDWYIWHLLGVKSDGQEYRVSGTGPDVNKLTTSDSNETDLGLEDDKVVKRVGTLRMWVRKADQHLLKDYNYRIGVMLLA